MNVYDKSCYDSARLFTQNYSTSFSASCRLIDDSIQKDIYAIYGFVRIADEIVDTYKSEHSNALLIEFEEEAYLSIDRGYSTNPIVHAFAQTARHYGIDRELIAPFFASMRMDIGKVYKQSMYDEYIYGSAEVIGLMCLRVFIDGVQDRYDDLKDGACALGSAYQKVNFLRDVKQDHDELERMYFPGIAYKTFSKAQKEQIELDIAADFEQAAEYIKKLPENCRAAVSLSYEYYGELLTRIRLSSIDEIKNKRVRVPNSKKMYLFASARVKKGVRGL